MAEVYEIVEGKPLEDYVAHMPGVQGELRSVAEDGGARARRLLAARADHRTGKSHIEVGQQKLDYHVYLVDADGAALSIEFGRAPAIYPDGSTDKGSEGLYVLHDALGVPHKAHAARNRRHRKKKRG